MRQTNGFGISSETFLDIGSLIQSFAELQRFSNQGIEASLGAFHFIG